MSQPNVTSWSFEDYERAALAYLRSLPLEHFMEATPQSTQRKITLESLDLLHARRSDVQVFNELLVQYPFEDGLGQVVPDNMVVLTKEPVLAVGSYNLPFEPARPLWVLEYVSPTNPRKDYKDSYQKYEQELHVPYYLLYYPHKQDLRLYHHTGLLYELVAPNAEGRLELTELDLEIALLNGWARYWHKGELLELPAVLHQQLEESTARWKKAERRAEQYRRRTMQAQRQVAEEKQRAQEEKQRAQLAVEAKQRAEQAKQQAEEERQQAHQATRRAEQAERRAKQEKRQAQQKLTETEAELARLRALLEQRPGKPSADE